ncbi:UbiA prenyltransferase family-domain-containing protein, partial [Clohesyomyces aquaticus]
HTLWLFTYSDLKTMVVPSTLFALSMGLAKVLSGSGSKTHEHMECLVRRIPAILLWTWINCLAFNVNNQRLPHAVREDTFNKPWRPMPSKRLNNRQAGTLAMSLYPIAVFTSWVLGGGLVPSLLLLLFGYLYNDLRMGDKTALIRNILNACGFTSFAAGGLEVALQSPTGPDTFRWLKAIGLIIVTTVHIQDTYDQTGDAAAGRLTIPLILGDGLARWTITIPMIVWSFICPRYWNVGPSGYLAVGGLGCIVIGRLLMVRSVKGDRTTFLIYNCWLVVIYGLP